MSNEPKQYTLLRKVLKALGLSDDRVDELIATIHAWLSDDQEVPLDAPQFPYHLRDDFFSPAELNFYRVLLTVTADWAALFSKVNLGDLFYPKTGEYGQNQAYRNKIARTTQKGANAGNSFWGCVNYPQCRGIRAVEMAG